MPAPVTAELRKIPGQRSRRRFEAVAEAVSDAHVRQLQNLIERLVVLSETGTITADDARRELAEAAAVTSEGGNGAAAPVGVAQVDQASALPGASVVPVGESRAPTGEMSAIDLEGAVRRQRNDRSTRRSAGRKGTASSRLACSASVRVRFTTGCACTASSDRPRGRVARCSRRPLARGRSHSPGGVDHAASSIGSGPSIGCGLRRENLLGCESPGRYLLKV